MTDFKYLNSKLVFPQRLESYVSVKITKSTTFVVNQFCSWFQGILLV